MPHQRRLFHGRFGRWLVQTTVVRRIRRARDKTFAVVSFGGMVIGSMTALQSLSLNPILALVCFAALLCYVAIFAAYVLALRTYGLSLALLTSCFCAVLWCLNAGFQGGAQYFFVDSFLVPLLILQGKRMYAAMSFSALLLAGLFLVEAYIPQWILPYTDPGDRFLDLVFSMSLSTVVTVGCVTFVLTGLQKQRRRTHTLNRALIQANKRLSEEARTDSLTGLANRRAFLAMLEHETARQARSPRQYPISVLLFDLDHFKEINDSRGHDHGDFALTQFSAILNATLRKQDVAARWGGEEFIVFLPETDIAGAYIAAEKVRRTLEAAPLLFRNRELRATVSCGAAELNAGVNVEQVIMEADNCLYEAKLMGRNCVVASDRVVTASL